jgi:hypothetical protein
MLPRKKISGTDHMQITVNRPNPATPKYPKPKYQIPAWTIVPKIPMMIGMALFPSFQLTMVDMIHTAVTK